MGDNPKLTLVFTLFGIGFVIMAIAGGFCLRSKTSRSIRSIFSGADFNHKMTVLLGSLGLLTWIVGFLALLGGYEEFMAMTRLNRSFWLFGIGFGVMALAGAFCLRSKTSRTIPSILHGPDFPHVATIILGPLGMLLWFLGFFTLVGALGA